jgi:type IV pilus assembly protein PilC
MRFEYKARDWSGKLIKGEGDFHDKKEVLETIKSNGLVPVYIGEEKDSLLKEVSKNIFSKVKLKQVSVFTRQLSTMMNSGLPLTDALSLLKNQANRGTLMYEILDYALTTIQGGQSLASGLGKYKKVFGEAYIASVEAGEEAGVLDEVMEKLADNLEKQSDFEGKVKGAMIYPVIVVVGMIIVVIIMMVFVIPKLLSMYSDFGAEIPKSTKILMSMSGFFTKFWVFIPILVVGFWLFLRIGRQSKKIKLKIDEFKFKIPIVGELIKKNILATSIRTLSMLLSAGIPLVEALKIVANVAENLVYLEAFIKISERVQKGFSISNSFEETGVFPIIVNQMVATGEATGKLDTVLLKVSDYFSSEAEQSVKSLTSAIEPMIMILLGIGVAFLVVAVLMPIYNLTSQF